MREIKFRAWNTQRGKMLVNPLWEWVENTEINWGFANSRRIWMQFTGLYDKNGKEIYEGDIVECLRQVEDETPISHIVEIKDIRFLPSELGGSNLISIEVIGNIYENPELLGGTK